jgi:hypothetical protein
MPSKKTAKPTLERAAPSRGWMARNEKGQLLE